MSGVRSLESLCLRDTAMTDESVRLLGSLPRLASLDLRQNRLTNQALAHAARMKTLRALLVGCEASNPSITDDGLLHLADLPLLEVLDLEGTAVTEKGLARLTALDLKLLRLRRTAVRDISPIREAFPECQIEL
jgi:hypothetical protein